MITPTFNEVTAYLTVAMSFIGAAIVIILSVGAYLAWRQGK